MPLDPFAIILVVIVNSDKPSETSQGASMLQLLTFSLDVCGPVLTVETNRRRILAMALSRPETHMDHIANTTNRHTDSTKNISVQFRWKTEYKPLPLHHHCLHGQKPQRFRWGPGAEPFGEVSSPNISTKSSSTLHGKKKALLNYRMWIKYAKSLQFTNTSISHRIL